MRGAVWASGRDGLGAFARGAAHADKRSSSFQRGEEATSEESAVDIERIVQDPSIRAGKPMVRGTRISVAVVLDYLAHNPDFGELFADDPRLTMDDGKACFAYARRLVGTAPRPGKISAPTSS
jgi:uncharacterized protein (DUF433 family)